MKFKLIYIFVFMILNIIILFLILDNLHYKKISFCYDSSVKMVRDLNSKIENHEYELVQNKVGKKDGNKCYAKVRRLVLVEAGPLSYLSLYDVLENRELIRLQGDEDNVDRINEFDRMEVKLFND